MVPVELALGLPAGAELGVANGVAGFAFWPAPIGEPPPKSLLLLLFLNPASDRLASLLVRATPASRAEIPATDAVPTTTILLRDMPRWPPARASAPRRAARCAPVPGARRGRGAVPWLSQPPVSAEPPVE
jgi:hypothetical protein